MSNKAVLYLGGGGLAAVWSAGVLAKLQENNAYHNIEAVYGCSAGVFNGTYFLSKQIDLAATVYCQDLTKDFIILKNIIPGLWQRIINAYIKPIEFEKIKNIMNLDKLSHIVKHEKKLDLNTFKNQPIPMYAKYYNTQTKQLEYIDIRKGDTLNYLHASSAIIPYYFPQKNNSKYIDAAILEPLSFEYLLKRYPNCKIVAILNLDSKRNIGHHLKNYFEGAISNTMLKNALIKCFIKREPSVRKNLKIAKKNKRILIIHRPLGSKLKHSTTNKKILYQGYENGKTYADKVMDFIN